ncbi:MAG: ClC family H(+)/Cl(-) exchange transporter [Escherichia coli]|nr:ClC family H(+)/Cl(-) exchange transporter [Escherichia coli]
MKTDTPSLETPQAARLRRRQLIRQLLERDKTPLAILFMAAVVGTLVGLAAVAFDKGVAWLQNQRMGALVHTADNYPLLLTVAFLCSAVLAMFGYFLVRKYAPEAGGSGIPEIEGALEDQRPVRWWRVLPVKFFGGLGTLGGGMVLGREGPTVQIGGNIGRMVLDIFRLKGDEARHTLLATGAAAGLAAAFNAPLAGILFIIEEMRPQFRYIGIIFGIFGPIFNKWVLGMQDLLHRVHGGNITKWVLMGGAIGGLCGLLGFVAPATSGGGFNLIPIATAGNFSMGMLVFIFVARVITTLLCFSSGAPGGIFAPMLALGTVLGTAFGMVAVELFPQYHLEAGTFAIAGMGALLAASIRAPLTGIILVLEMTDNYQLILPMIITGLGATLLAQFTGGKPLYSAILARTLAKQEAEQLARSKAASASENT